jgi:hypothetical protein
LLPDYQARSGIENLKTTFLLYLIANILIFVPIVGLIGGVLDLVALIFLIISWRTLGRSALSQAHHYKSTGRWLLWAIMIVIIGFVVGIIVLSIFFVMQLISSGALSSLQNGTSSATNFFQQSGNFRTFLGEILVLFGGMYAIWVAAWTKMGFSIKKLSSEITTVPRLNTTGNLYIFQALLGYANSLFTYILFLLGVLTLPTNSSSSFTYFFFGSLSGLSFGGLWPILTLVSLATTVIMIIASFLGYSSLKSYPGRAQVAPPPSMPPTVTAPQPEQQQATPEVSKTCPNCGHVINIPSSSYCPNCGAKLGSFAP